MKPLQIGQLMDQEITKLSGGELQRVALCVCLRKPADIYLIDEPSAYLESSVDCIANSPQSLLTGMNLFLFQLDITFRHDPTNYRPGINKLNSTKDREQKAAGSYYYLDD
ncbi:hypothetical protein CerSpe_105170 [Prunus speciosa]